MYDITKQVGLESTEIELIHGSEPRKLVRNALKKSISQTSLN